MPLEFLSPLWWFILLRTIAIGAAGGAIFAWLNMPLPWMIGAMVATTSCSLGGTRMKIPIQMRSVMIAVIGVLLGASFTPEIFEKAGEWMLSLICLMLYLSLLIAVLFVYFRQVAGFDVPTAYFSATPGGLAEMVVAGAAAGADDRVVALIHASRVLLVVLIIPFWFRITTGVIPEPSSIGPSIVDIESIDMLMLATCALVGSMVGKLIRMPAWQLAGPMLASAAVHATGITESAPPWEIVAIAQVIVGSSLGSRFSGVPLRKVRNMIALSLSSTAVMLVATVGFAFGLQEITGIEWHSIVLAYSPGGLAEMSIIALSLGMDTAFIAVHHVFRISLIVMAAPITFNLLGRLGRSGGD